eukprot:CAMPEP_0201625564 /NCGR_PEP_ID=MMETSP0493-20130528/1312_1 /ASSEMBLY_ACC=CAM_ASM_000838 /TAXON_ID=420259 /ORGANISM="Thalassiosira gravida, Strain GMp14c1" /LENGTH=248 /DNA_ID=CAMNT_0048095565 /DNA_START=46 /DNA_END=792 /DNA_ORIENTATION=-
MSNLRKVSNKDSPEEDVEAPIDKESPKISTAFAAASTSDSFSAPGAGKNPVFLAKVIARKVLALLASSSDEEGVTQPSGFIALLKDVIVGIILGVMTISTLIFLDHRDVVHFQSAHNFRNAAFQLLNDPETIANVEESSDLKFMTIIEYESKRKELDSVVEKKAGNEEILKKRTEEAEVKKKEVEGMREEYEKLMGNPLLQLGSFCGSCSWKAGTTCDSRVQFLKDTYNTRPIHAKLNAMLHESCITK